MNAPHDPFSRLSTGLAPAGSDAGFRSSFGKAELNTLGLRHKTPAVQSCEDGLACCLSNWLGFYGNLKQAGTSFAWARLASNSYPEAFFVSTSVSTTEMMRKLLVAPAFILAISDLTELHSGTQAVFFVPITFSSGTLQRSRFSIPNRHYTTAPASPHTYRHG